MSVFKRWNGTTWEPIGPQLNSAFLEQIKNIVAVEYDPTIVYPVGSYAIYNNKLYKSITQVEDLNFDINHWTLVNLAEEEFSIKTNFDEWINLSQEELSCKYTNGKYVRYIDGTLSTNNLKFSYSSYIYVEKYDYIRLKHICVPSSDPASGLAFFSKRDPSGFISGIQAISNKDKYYYDEYRLIKVPQGANFLRISALGDLDLFKNYPKIYGIRNNNILSGLKQIDYIDNFSIKTDGDTVDINNAVPNEGCKYSVIPCYENDMFTINGFGGDEYRLWCFCDASRNVLLKAIKNVNAYETLLCAPKNSAFLILNDNSNSNVLSYYGTKFYYLDNIRLAPKKNLVLKKPENDIVCYNSQDLTTGLFTSTTQMLPLPETKDHKVYHNGYGYGNYYSIGFFDINKQIIDFDGNNNGKGSSNASNIPDNAKFFVLSNMNSDNGYNFVAYFNCTELQWSNYIAKLSNYNGEYEIISLLDNIEWTQGFYINKDNGNLIESNNYYYSDFINLPKNLYNDYIGIFNYVDNTAARVAFYDGNKIYLKGETSQQQNLQTFAIPENSKYIRICTKNSIVSYENCLAIVIHKINYSDYISLNKYSE